MHLASFQILVVLSSETKEYFLFLVEFWFLSNSSLAQIATKITYGVDNT